MRWLMIDDRNGLTRIEFSFFGVRKSSESVGVGDVHLAKRLASLCILVLHSDSYCFHLDYLSKVLNGEVATALVVQRHNGLCRNP
jgi:hypothetical protein